MSEEEAEDPKGGDRTRGSSLGQAEGGATNDRGAAGAQASADDPARSGGTARGSGARRRARNGEKEGFARYLQRRRVANYELGLARTAYAYGVDLRRSRWLAHSSVGDALIRAVDRAWPSFAATLARDHLDPADVGTPTPLLAEIDAIVGILRAPRPTLWFVRPDSEARARWPPVMCLGAAHGDIRWLVLDLPRLLALPEHVRAFELARNVAHLQCDHGVYFTAQWMLRGSRRPRLGPFAATALTLATTPWRRVMDFSSDRGALLCAGELERTRLALRESVALRAPYAWLLGGPSEAMRERALEDFARTAVFLRVVAQRSARRRDPLAAMTTTSSADGDLAATSSEAPEDEPHEAPGADPHADPANPPPRATPAGVPEGAWSLARADRRLTERLGLL